MILSRIMPSELYLIGIGHYDQQGQERLEKLLLQIFPDIVSVEYNEAVLPWIDRLEKARQSPGGIQKLVDEFCKKGTYDPENVRQYVHIINFEYFAAREYCKKWSKPLLFSDFGAGSLSQRHFHEILSRPIQTTQQLIEMAYQSPVIPVPQQEVPQLLKRDEYAETKLRPLSGKVVHVAGAWHLFGNYCNLYERVRDLNPCRIMLKQADYF